ncbi:hypothetical protein [Terasakiella pusilla]|uniref:hypothetical protein n=1 Tax=Terasakiella pusilla TaxID=64973 RepID=UPI00048FDCA4|nr:hypothetical protein [Terasakiella pusilla]
MVDAVGSSGIVYGASQSQGDFDVGTLMMMLSLERADSLESQLKDQANQMKNINDEIKMANHFMAEARRLKESAGDEVSNESSATPFKMADGTTVTMTEFFKSRGVSKDTTGNDTKHNKGEWDVNIEHIKTHADSLNSTSQLEMIRLQSLMNKRNQAFEMASNVMNKLSGVMDKIIGNMR